jgi:hypothetical protein
MTASASATINVLQLDATTYQYTVTLSDVSPGPASDTNTIGTFWFAWQPGQDYLASAPLSVSSPTGWTFQQTGGEPNDGFAIRWVATTPAAEIQARGSLGGFEFTSSDPPSVIFGDATFFPTTPILTSVVYTGAPFSDSGTTFVVACFLAGTCILTSRGEIPVEALVAGDIVETDSEAGPLPVKWLGHRRLDCGRHPRPRDVWPVRIARGAFAPGAPTRDVFLSPDHAVYTEGVLIPVRYLGNGATIVQVPMDKVSYYHVELSRHAPLLANGLPAESYLDTGNRGAFANGGGAVEAHADFAFRVWDQDAFAPLVLGGPKLVATKKRLLARAKALGHSLTVDPDLRLFVHGMPCATQRQDSVFRFRLPPGAREARLVSRTAIPSEVDARSADCRCLGVAVVQMALDGAAIPLGDPHCGSGWHAPEGAWRWTDGNAVVMCGGAKVLEIHLAYLHEYWADVANPANGAAVA